MHCFWRHWINMSVYDQISNCRSVWGISLRKWREHGDGIRADISALVDCSSRRVLTSSSGGFAGATVALREPYWLFLMIWNISWVTLCHYFVAGSVLPCHLLQDWSWQIQGNRYSQLPSLRLSQQTGLFLSTVTVVWGIQVFNSGILKSQFKTLFVLKLSPV